ncbi:MAG: M6 family metalloprotease domain-containing protein [Gemmatimonadetes bacterium]|nr:M6 family metalloprotease domain-containing protein [Gemmatimonadota bacterium]
MKIAAAPWLGAALAAALAAPVAAQDVELLGQIYGTRPPAAYFERRAADPAAFEMVHGLAARRRPASGQALLRVAGSGASLTLGDRRVYGTYRFPVLLGLFSDSPAAPFGQQLIQTHFFDGPNPNGTIPDLYAEMSGGLVKIVGVVHDWSRSRFSKTQVTAGVSALSASSRLGSFILDLLAQAQGVDWGSYDNDGPDGQPNSGDDDGYVDVLAIVHPTPGAECGGIESAYRVWSHKWNLRAAAGQDYVTTTPSAKPGFGAIRVSDYTIQPAYACYGTVINEIGVFAHELGHGFGLPDLYAPGGGQAGAGRWDLMGTGAWGCSVAFEPEKPCHMGAWSKAALGWVEVQTVPFGSDPGRLTLDAVETTRRVVAIPSGDGSGEYYLLENRQRIGFDAHLSAPGLLVWQIDPTWINYAIKTNTVNDAAAHMGVWLRQADGFDQLAKVSSQSGNRGDAGDPFPGSTRNTAFHAGSTPASFTNAKVATGVTLTEIAEAGTSVSFNVLSRYHTLRIRSSGDVGSSPLFTVDGVSVAGAAPSLRSAPYQKHIIEAIAGAPLADGIRRGFAGWRDAPGTSRVRVWTTALADAELEAVYGGSRDMRFSATQEGARFNVAPGRIVATPASPDLWFAEGTTVAFQAQPTTGFQFRQWQGALEGRPNPLVLVMDQPRDATAAYDFVFAIEPNLTLSVPAAAPRDVIFQVNNANAPTSWSLLKGALPDGLAFQITGKLTGEAMTMGTFPLELSVTDALGLRATGTITLKVTAPEIGLEVLTAPFLRRPDVMTALQRRYLDKAGNNDGVYDLGDFRAFVLANPNAALTAQAEQAGARVLPVADFAPPEGP